MIAAAAPSAQALTVVESSDFSNTQGAAETYTLEQGLNFFSGSMVEGGPDEEDHLKVTVPAGFYAVAVSSKGNGGETRFNNEAQSGATLSAFVQGFPLPAGTYSVAAIRNFSLSQVDWKFAILLANSPGSRQLIKPVAVDSLSENGYLYPPSQLIDGSGLSPNPTFANFAALTHAPVTESNVWVTNTNGSQPDYYNPPPLTTPSLIFSLGGLYRISEFVYWGYDFDGAGLAVGNEAKRFNIFVSTNGVDYSFAGFYIKSDGPVGTAPNVVAFPPVNAAYVQLVLVDNHYSATSSGGDRVGLGEVRFVGSRIVLNTLNTGTGSLRQTIAEAAAGDVITFDPILSGDTIGLSSGITLSKTLTIDASEVPGGISISGNQTVGIFYVADSMTVALRNLELVDGLVFADSGGAIDIGFDTNVNIRDCSFLGNSVLPSGFGGAMINRGSLTMTSCTFSGNTAESGGAIFNHSNGSASIINSTFSGNSAESAGAILNYGNLTVDHCTISKNSAGDRGGGVWNDTGISNFHINNSILAGNSAPINPNLDGDGIGGDNLLAGDPRLTPLADYYGPTQTMVPLPDSPAINASAVTTITTDQRGFARDGSPDIGAVEYLGYPDVSLYWESDFDGDGSPTGLEIAQGTDALLSDRNNPRNFTISFYSGAPHLIFGKNLPDGLHLKWTISRQTTLPGVPEEIYFLEEGPTESAVYYGNVYIEDSISPPFVTVHDLTPNQPKAFYTLRADLLP